MVFSVTARVCVLAVTLTCIFLSCCTLAKSEEEDVPYEGGGGGIGGAAGGGGVGGVGGGGIGGTGGGGGSGGGGIGGSGGGGGIGGTGGGGGIGGGGVGGGGDPAEIVAKALLCFNDRYIYSSCEESYRLTESGNLNVSPDHTEEYCHGPCLTETHLVLDCIDNILSHFLFYNRATIGDVRDTIKAGCGYGPERGNFDVSEHIQAEEGSGNKVTSQILLPLVSLIMGAAVLLQY